MTWSRRQFLSALGLGSAALATGIRPAWSQDAGTGAIKRLVIVSNGHGNVHGHWRIPFEGRPTDRLWDASLVDLPEDRWSPVLRPLYPFRRKLLAIDGLSLSSAELDLAGYRHEKGWVHAWTGDWGYFTGSDLLAAGPSLDQLVARHVARPDRLASLELQVEEGRPVCHAGQAQPLPLEGDPLRVYRRLFGGTSEDDLDPARRNAALDFAAAEAEALRPRLGAEDRQRLEAHFTLVRELGARIRGLAEARCETDGDLEGRVAGTRGYAETYTAMVELVRAAFACDLTRVVTLSLGDLTPESLPFRPVSGSVHDSWAHQLYTDPEAERGMTAYMAVHAQQVAQLAAALDSVPDPQGGTLLDHTLIAWGSEMGDGWHGYERYCVSLLGGTWHFQPGRYVHHPERVSPIQLVGPTGEVRGGTPHQHVLVSLAQAMGLDTDHVGLAEVQARTGERIVLRGPLDGLTAEVTG